MTEASEKLVTGARIEELWALIKAGDEELAAADVKIVTGSYRGTGANGVTLDFGFVPKFVYVVDKSVWWNDEDLWYADNRLIWLTGLTQETGPAYQYGNFNRNIKQEGTTLSWSMPTNIGAPTSSPVMLNNSGYTYLYVAIG